MLLALISIPVFSQVSYNIKAGMNMSDFTKDDFSKMKVGFQIGVGMDYAFDNTWSFQPSLLLTTKGAKSDSEEDFEVKANPIYIELPLMLAAKVNVASDVNVVFSAGPYAAYGIGGKNTVETSGISVETDFFGDEDEGGAKRFDAGVGAGVGLELSKFLIGFNAELGLTKLYSDSSSKNLNFAVTVGYRF
jgi:hypothetical protein